MTQNTIILIISYSHADTPRKEWKKASHGIITLSSHGPNKKKSKEIWRMMRIEIQRLSVTNLFHLPSPKPSHSIRILHSPFRSHFVPEYWLIENSAWKIGVRCRCRCVMPYHVCIHTFGCVRMKFYFILINKTCQTGCVENKKNCVWFRQSCYKFRFRIENCLSFVSLFHKQRCWLAKSSNITRRQTDTHTHTFNNGFVSPLLLYLFLLCRRSNGFFELDDGKRSIDTALEIGSM